MLASAGLAHARPEVSLHCHLIGSVQAGTPVDLAPPAAVTAHTRIRDIVDARLLVTININGPPMFGTDPATDLRVLADARGTRAPAC